MDERLVKIDDNTYSFEDSFVRCFLLLGKEKALWVDSGVSGADLKALAREITELPTVLINTHGDGDHTSGNGSFDRYYMHSEDYVSSGLKEKCPESRCEYVADGTTIDLGGRILEIWEIPGHTKGSIAILDVNTRRLIAGDSVQNGIIYMFGEKRAPKRFDDSLNKLIGKSDKYDTVLCSHGERELPAEYVGKVKNCWQLVLAGKAEGIKENLWGNPVTTYKFEDCGFYCD